MPHGIKTHGLQGGAANAVVSKGSFNQSAQRPLTSWLSLRSGTCTCALSVSSTGGAPLMLMGYTSSMGPGFTLDLLACNVHSTAV